MSRLGAIVLVLDGKQVSEQSQRWSLKLVCLVVTGGESWSDMSVSCALPV